MPSVRRRLSWIIRVWLICQVAGLAAAPFALCCASLASADQTPACCRGLSPGQTCPMHHGGEEDRTCKMRSACSRSDAALLTLAGGLGVLPTATTTVTAFDPGDVVSALSPSARLRTDRPESPPPRA
jgi:hypothetical protein